MNVSVKHFSASIDTIRDYIPGSFLSGLVPGNYHLFCAIADSTDNKKEERSTNRQLQNIPVGVILYTILPSDTPAMELKYFFVPGRFRGMGVGSVLLRETLSYIRKGNVRYVYADLPPREKDGIGYLLEQNGFRREQTVSVLSYSLEDIMESPLGKNLDKMKPLLNKLTSLNEIDKPVLAEFIPVMRKKKDPTFDVKNLNNIYTKFFIHKSSICGCMSFEQVLPEVLELKTFYVKKDPAVKYAIPTLLSGIILEAVKHMGTDVTMVMKLEDRNLTGAVLNACGAPLLTVNQDRLFLHIS